MLKRITAKIAIIAFIFTISAFNIFAQTQESDLPITSAYEIERTGKFLEDPGNNDYEILRRIGRSINKELPSDKDKFSAATLFDVSKINSKNFLQPVTEELLSENQKKEVKQLLSNYSAQLDEMANELSDEKEAIIAKGVFESERTKSLIQALLSDEKSSVKLQEEEKKQIEQNIYPVLESFDYVLTVLSISNKGIFAKGKMVSETNKLKNIDMGKITISDYLNENALIYLVQNHGKTDAEKTYEDLKLIPQTKIIEDALNSVELDFKKDLLSNMADESIMYLNLEPSGEGSLPDFRIVAPVPDIKALNDILPKLKKLCIQMGIYAEVMEDKKLPAVKVSFMMLKNYAIYMGLVDDIFVMATGYDNIKEEMDHIANIKAKKSSEKNNPLGKYKRYGKIRTKDFNIQLQRFLASPLLQNEGIPPIPNLNCLDDLENITFSMDVNPTLSQINVEIPISKK